jgi:hypothetical protein
LGELRDNRAVEPLLALLSDSDTEVRGAIPEALARLKDDRAIDPLLAALSDPEGKVRESTARALGELRGNRAVEPLLVALSDPEGKVRESAAQALGRLGDSRAVVPLLLWKETRGLSAPSVVVAALAALGNLPALQEFQIMMRDGPQSQRTTALWAIACLEPDPLDRILLSRDADGVSPGIDCKVKLRLENARRYARITHLTLDEVRGRYQRLQGKYPLQLAW